MNEKVALLLADAAGIAPVMNVRGAETVVGSNPGVVTVVGVVGFGDCCATFTVPRERQLLRSSRSAITAAASAQTRSSYAPGALELDSSIVPPTALRPPARSEATRKSWSRDQ